MQDNTEAEAINIYNSAATSTTMVVSNERTPASTYIESFLRLCIAAPKGAAQVYATFGPIAMIYKKNGLWLIAPVALGAAISLSDTLIKTVNQYHKNDFALMKILADGSFFLSERGVAFLSEYGFTLSMIRQFITIFSPLLGLSDSVAKPLFLIGAPIAAFPLAILINKQTYHTKCARLNAEPGVEGIVDNPPNRNRVSNFVTTTLVGASSTSGFFNQLSLQGVLPPGSYVPLSFTALGALTGAASSLMSESYSKISKILSLAIVLLGINPSLATYFMAFPDDIYAGVNNWKIPDSYFFTMLAVSILFFLMLEFLTVLNVLTKTHEAQHIITENSPLLINGVDNECTIRLNDDSDEEQDEESRTTPGLFNS